MSAKELETYAKYERYYDAAGIRTRCFEKGEGKPVILLHGGGGHARYWCGQDRVGEPRRTLSSQARASPPLNCVRRLWTRGPK